MRTGSLIALAAVALSMAMSSPGVLAGSVDKTASKAAKNSNAAKRQASKSSPKRAVPAPEPEPLTEAQLKAAKLVQVGRADCEFAQSILVEPDHKREGAFRVSFERKTYQMVPEETPTGAVRMFDNAAGVAWLQLGLKSMLMNVKAGQRMVDACTHPAQRLVQAQVDVYAADQARLAAAAAAAAALGSSGSAAAQADPNAPVTGSDAIPAGTPSAQAAPPAQDMPLLKN